jgi:peptide/nickel transport system substrate-binding protein
LFLYGDNSLASRAVLSALYDGPLDLPGYQPSPFILAEVPRSDNGGLLIENVQAAAGALVADHTGAMLKLQVGAQFLPPGCRSSECQQAYNDQGSAVMDQMVVRFKLAPGLKWSDGAPLTAADSVYSYEVARALFPRARSELLQYTASYIALDELTIEWRSIPGYRSSAYQTYFFTPLPQHRLGGISPQDLFSNELSSRAPLGWGAYLIESWAPGDHIALAKNPQYFKAGAGLPHFDRLVFRFTPDSAQALQALQAGECDLLDESALATTSLAELKGLQAVGKARLWVGRSAAWEQITFGLLPVDPQKTSLFQSAQVRQALAMCINRQALNETVFAGNAPVRDNFTPDDHPLYNSAAQRYPYEPAAGAGLLNQAGWIDQDGDPQTPRASQGVPGLPDGIPFEFTYRTIAGQPRQQAAEMIRQDLAACGVRANLALESWESLFAAGPEGPAFGRNFEAVQFAWMSGAEPPCYLFTSQEIPGPYPQFPKGWGGANLGGFTNPEFDRLCQQASNTLPESAEYSEAQRRIQELFAQELPVIPLYQHPRYALSRPDFCGLALDAPASSVLWNIEAFDYGQGCQ